MEIKVSAKFIRMAPKKVRLVADLIKGLDASVALTQLDFSNKSASLPVKKLLKSAISNAEENYQLKRSNLFVKEIRVDGGPTLHRWQPRAHGRATPIRKRSSHIFLILEERVPTEKSALKSKTKPTTEDDLVKIEDLDELKSLEKETRPEEKVNLEDSKKNISKKTTRDKGFVNKIFNRKSGQK